MTNNKSYQNFISTVKKCSNKQKNIKYTKIMKHKLDGKHSVNSSCCSYFLVKQTYTANWL